MTDELAEALQMYVIAGMAGCKPSGDLRESALALLARVQQRPVETIRRDFQWRADGYARSNQRLDAEKRAEETGPAPRMRKKA